MLSSILKESIIRLESLKEYYKNQYELIMEHIEQVQNKYEFGFYLYIRLLYKMQEYDHEYVDSIFNKYKQIYDDNVDIISMDSKTKTVSFNFRNPEFIKELEYEIDPVESMKKIREQVEFINVLFSSTIMMTIIRFEDTVSDIFKYLINKYPEAYLSNRNLSYSKILQINPNEMKNVLVAEEIDEIMRKNISNWFEIYKEKHDLKFEHISSIINEFKEVYYRRNLLVHTKGRVNAEYIKNVPSEFTEATQIGNVLLCDDKYINRAIDLTYLMIYGMFMSLLKISDGDHDLVMDILFNSGFNHMTNGEWCLSEFIFMNLSNYNKQKDVDKMMSLFNYWISMKNLDKMDEVKNRLEKFDFSASKIDFQIAREVLLENFEEANSLMQKNPDVIPAYYIETWPLFIQYRQSPQFQEFKEKNPSLFNKLEIKLSEDPSMSYISLVNKQENLQKENTICH